LTGEGKPVPAREVKNWREGGTDIGTGIKKIPRGCGVKAGQNGGGGVRGGGIGGEFG